MIKLFGRRDLTFKQRWHSNWTQIKKHKSELDMKKATERTKLSIAIAKAVKSSGPDPSNNAWLNRLLSDAKRIEMPKKVIDETIQRAIRDKSGDLTFYEARFKQFFFYIQCNTDNKVRTSQFIRKIVQDKNGQFCSGSDTSKGTISWMFREWGMVEYYAPLSSSEISTISSSLDFIIHSVRSNPRLLSEEMKVERGEMLRHEAIVPESINFDELIDAGIEVGAEEVNIVHVPAHSALQNTGIPFYVLEQMDENLLSYLPPIQAIQALCKPKYRMLVEEDLKMYEFESVRRKGSKDVVFIHRTEVVQMPNLAEYTSDAIWQDANCEDGEIALEIIDKLKSEIDEVEQVWHNIRNVEPWNGMIFESQEKTLF